MVAELPKAVPLIGFCGAPWTVATYMVEGGGSKDQAAARLLAYRDEAAFQRLIDLLVEVSADYLVNQVKAGARALQIFDSWAGSLPEDEFERWCIAPTKRLVELVKAKLPDIPVIGFPRGAGVLAERYARDTGIDAIGCDTSMPIGWMRDEIAGASPGAGQSRSGASCCRRTGARRVASRRSSKRSRSRPFIFNLGHGILPETPIEHVTRLVGLVKAGAA